MNNQKKLALTLAVAMALPLSPLTGVAAAANETIADKPSAETVPDNTVDLNTGDTVESIQDQVKQPTEFKVGNQVVENNQSEENEENFTSSEPPLSPNIDVDFHDDATAVNEVITIEETETTASTQLEGSETSDTNVGSAETSQSPTEEHPNPDTQTEEGVNSPAESESKIEEESEVGDTISDPLPDVQIDDIGAELGLTADISTEESATESITEADTADIDAMVNEWLTVRSNAAEEGSVTVPTSYGEVYDRMAALVDEYPEGKEWTNFTPYGKDGPLADTYWWNGGAIKGASGGVGCAAFAFILSDRAFGDLPARTMDNGSFTYEDIKVGDILRVNNSHFVVVMQKSAGGVTVAEANYNKSVHWGRALSVDDVMNANFVVTRYPTNFVSADDEDADTVVQSGKENLLDWNLTKTGVLTVSGNGTLPDYSPNDDYMPSWHKFNNSITSIILKNGITGIGNYSFFQSNALTAYLAESIMRIGQSAFRESDLISITIPESVKTIENDAFRDCKNLTSATIPDGVETIGDNAFRGDTSLEYVDFPSTVTNVGSGAFTSCEHLVRIRFAPGTEKAILGENLFTQCWNLQNVILPQGLTGIAPGMFSSCKSLFSLYIPKSVTNLTSAGEESPFTSAGIRRIEFGGSEAEWNAMLNKNPYLRATLQGIQVVFDVEFENPFAAIPNDPGDIKFDETVDPDNPDNPDNPGGDIPDTPNPPVGPNPPSGSTPDEPEIPNDSQSSRSDTPAMSGTDTSNEMLSDGSIITTTIRLDGTKEIEIQVSLEAIDNAALRNEPVVLPISAAEVVKNQQFAPNYVIRTGSKTPVAVAIPVVNPTQSTVFAIVNADGTTRILARSLLKDNYLIVPLSDSVKVKILDNYKEFTDVASDSAAIAFVTSRELISGTSETTFSPNAPMTCATLLAALARLDDIEEANSTEWGIENSFIDSADLEENVTTEQLILMLWKYCGKPTEDAMSWAIDNNIIDVEFDAHQELTRAEIAQALNNFVVNVLG